MSSSSKTGNKVTVRIDPYFKDAIVKSFVITESIGGDLAGGYIILKTSLEGDYDSNEIEVKIKSEDGIDIRFKAYIYRREVSNLELKLMFFTCPKTFMSDVRVASYKSIDAVISSLWEGKLDNPIRSDIHNSEFEVHQCRQTDYQFLTKILHGYKLNSFFGYGFESLIIRDMDSYEEVDEFHVVDMSPKKLGKSKYYGMDSEDSMSIELGAICHHKDYAISRDSTLELHRNYYTNRKFNFEPDVEVNISLNQLLALQIGDGVKLTSTSIKFSKNIVWSRVIEYSENTVRTFLGIKSISN